MSKYEINTDEIEKFSKMFKALSNPGRLRILLELARCIPKEGFSGTQEEQENSQQDFAQCLGLAQSTVSHHFKERRKAGLIYMRREKKKTIISVNFEALESIQKLLK